jgi:hypothetical protein
VLARLPFVRAQAARTAGLFLHGVTEVTLRV